MTVVENRNRIRMSITLAPEVRAAFEEAAGEEHAGSVSLWLESLGRRDCKRRGIAIPKPGAKPAPVPRPRVRRPPKA